ncbi:hypothetical protein GCM10010232_62470 [Streptomyces amakusaensis]
MPFTCKTERDFAVRTDCWARPERVLLTREQVRAYGLPATEGRHGEAAGGERLRRKANSRQLAGGEVERGWARR